MCEALRASIPTGPRRGRKKVSWDIIQKIVLFAGRWRFALCPSPGALMTYPDERSESLEGQMQSYTIPRRRSLFGMDV